jgi:hypothetical protein
MLSLRSVRHEVAVTNRSMTRALAVAAVLLATAMPAVAEDWRETRINTDAGIWVLQESGQFLSGDPYAFYASTEQGGAKLEIGCSAGDVQIPDTIDLKLVPPAGTLPPERFTVRYEVNGKLVAYQTVSGSAGQTSLTSAAEAGSYGPGEELAEAMASAWQGEITVTFHQGWASPPGPAFFTHAFSFDEDIIGGASEIVLTACSLR